MMSLHINVCPFADKTKFKKVSNRLTMINCTTRLLKKKTSVIRGLFYASASLESKNTTKGKLEQEGGEVNHE